MFSCSRFRPVLAVACGLTLSTTAQARGIVVFIVPWPVTPPPVFRPQPSPVTPPDWMPPLLPPEEPRAPPEATRATGHAPWARQRFSAAPALAGLPMAVSRAGR